VLTHGLHYGSAVFEGERSYGGNIFKLEAHTDRLIELGPKLLGFEIPYNAAQINQACIDVMAANKLTDAYLRPLAWRGSEQARRFSATDQNPSDGRLLVLAEPVRGRPAERGAPGPRRLAPPPPTNRPHRLQGGRAVHDRHAGQAQAAEAEGYNDALMLTWDGYRRRGHRRHICSSSSTASCIPPHRTASSTASRVSTVIALAKAPAASRSSSATSRSKT
jgi:branched-chain amino acid aminotransferase